MPGTAEDLIKSFYYQTFRQTSPPVHISRALWLCLFRLWQRCRCLNICQRRAISVPSAALCSSIINNPNHRHERQWQNISSFSNPAKARTDRENVLSRCEAISLLAVPWRNTVYVAARPCVRRRGHVCAAVGVRTVKSCWWVRSVIAFCAQLRNDLTFFGMKRDWQSLPPWVFQQQRFTKTDSGKVVYM